MTSSSLGQSEQKMFVQEGFLGTYEMPECYYSAQKLLYRSMTSSSLGQSEQKMFVQKGFLDTYEMPK